jgi:hypothetical protein
MPHVDELLGPAALAAAGLFAAIAIQPVPAAAPRVAIAADGTHAPAVVRLPTVEVVGRREAAVATDRPVTRKAAG